MPGAECRVPRAVPSAACGAECRVRCRVPRAQSRTGPTALCTAPGTRHRAPGTVPRTIRTCRSPRAGSPLRRSARRASPCPTGRASRRPWSPCWRPAPSSGPALRQRPPSACAADHGLERRHDAERRVRLRAQRLAGRGAFLGRGRGALRDLLHLRNGLGHSTMRSASPISCDEPDTWVAAAATCCAPSRSSTAVP